jgi:hypothetical protein
MKEKILIIIAFLLLSSIIMAEVNAQLQPITASSEQLPSGNQSESVPPICTSPAIYQQAQLTFQLFLNQVAAINTDHYNVTCFTAYTSKVLGSSKNQTTTGAIIKSTQTKLYIAMILIEGKVRFYDLKVLAGSLYGPQISFADSLTTAKKAIQNYQNLFGASYCNKFEQLIPDITRAQSLTIDSDGRVLNIKYLGDSKTPLEYAILTWSQNIDGVTIPGQSVQATVSNTGILTSFADSLGLYKVATTCIAISQQQARDIAMPYINTYATANNKAVENITTTLGYVTDLNGTRGDSYTIYPQWGISATFGKSSSDVDGFNVLVWADNGQVRDKGVQGYYRSMANPWLSINTITVIGILTIIPIIGLTACVLLKGDNKGGKHKSTLRSGVVLLLILSLSSLLLIQPASAGHSAAFASTYNVNEDEIDLQQMMTGYIYDWADYRGLTSYNLWASGTTGTNLCTAAYDWGDSYSDVFYIGHGNASAISDNDGNSVTATAINDSSYSLSYGHTKFALLWSCDGGDSKDGMPAAWTHHCDLSDDGYHYPDLDSDQLFIGWYGEAPFLQVYFEGNSYAGYWILYHFYYNSLLMEMPADVALDATTQTMWFVNYDESVLYTGTWWGANMVVYGDGNMCIAYGEDPPAMSNVDFYAPDYWGNQLPVNMYVDDGLWIISAGSSGELPPGEHTVSFDSDCYTSGWPVYYTYDGCDWSSQLSFEWNFPADSGQSVTAYYIPQY